MPKKSRSSSRSSTAKFTPTFAAAQRSAVEFNPDYSNIKRDLQRIGVLAGGFFVILIVLSFFLR